jgi:hypothetical protein
MDQLVKQGYERSRTSIQWIFIAENLIALLRDKRYFTKRETALVESFNSLIRHYLAIFKPSFMIAVDITSMWTSTSKHKVTNADNLECY